jgi:hypothetical protein
VPKESKELIDLLEGVVEKVKAGAEVNDYLTLIGDLCKHLMAWTKFLPRQSLKAEMRL